MDSELRTDWPDGPFHLDHRGIAGYTKTINEIRSFYNYCVVKKLPKPPRFKGDFIGPDANWYATNFPEEYIAWRAAHRLGLKVTKGGLT